MKKIFLVRHAKAEPHDLKKDDAERALSNRGKTDALTMASLIKKAGHKAEIIYCSPAVRALTTARIFASQVNYPPDSILISPVLYSFNTTLILSFFSGLPQQAQTVFIFGHNPNFHEIANMFSGGQISSMPTCSIAAFEFETNDWSDIETCNKKLILFDFPSNNR